MDQLLKDHRRLHYLVLSSRMGECAGDEDELWDPGGYLFWCFSVDSIAPVEGQGDADEEWWPAFPYFIAEDAARLYPRD